MIEALGDRETTVETFPFHKKNKAILCLEIKIKFIISFKTFDKIKSKYSANPFHINQLLIYNEKSKIVMKFKTSITYSLI
jgi:hypothetical protein